MIDPWFVFETTARCNAECPYCYTVWSTPCTVLPAEMALRQIETLFTRLATEVVIGGITLAGGEPLFRPDLPEIAACLRKVTPMIGVATNGMRLDAAFLGRLLAAGVGYFELSLPAVDEEGFRRLTGLNGVRVVRDAMLELAAARVPFTVSTVLTRINRDGIGDVIELAAACGAAAVALNRFVPGGRGAAHADSLSLDDASLWAVLQAAGTAAARCAIPVACTIPIEPCLIPHDGLPHLEFTACACGERKWAIAPDGGLRTCEQNPQVLGNLLSESFATLIAKTAVQAFRRNERRGSTCRDCISRTVCGGGCRFIGRQEAPATVCAATSSE